MRYPELQLDIGLWQNKPDEDIKKDVSSALLEFQRKPNLYWLSLEELTKLLDGTRTDHPIYQSEHTALTELVNWAAFGETEYAAWMSDQFAGFYKCPRLIISKKFEERGKVRILNVAACLSITSKQCLRIAEAFLGVEPNTLTDPEELRDRPIEFNLPEEKSFPELVKILTGKTIQELFAEKLKTQQDAEVLVAQNKNAIKNAYSLESKILAGANLEQQALAMGYAINQFRDCPGISNMDALKMLGAFDGVYYFGTLSAKSGKYEYKSGNCRVCKAETLVGPCNVCVPCEKKFDSGELR